MATKGSMESLMSVLGQRGRFQLTMLLLIAYTYILLVFHHVIMTFHGMSVPHTCMPDEVDIVNLSSPTYTVFNKDSVVNSSYGKCDATLYFLDGSNETMTCPDDQLAFEPTDGEKTLVSEFRLVCSDKYLASLATTIYFAGVMVGGLVFGDLADRFGRLPIMLTTLYLSSAIGVITSFSTSYTMFATLRFITGILMQGMQSSGYTLVMELFVAKHRPFAGAITECFFGCGIMMIAGLAFVMRDWRYLQIAISIPGFLAIFYICVVPESLRWLVLKGKLDKAEALIRRICRINKLVYPEGSWEMLKRDCGKPGAHNEKKEHTILDVLRTQVIRKRSLILFYLWLATSTNYYGLTFKMTTFTDSKYLTFFIGGVVETISYASSMAVMRLFGRRKTLMMCLIFSSVMCVTAGFLSDYTSGLKYVIVTLALAGRCAMAMVFATLFVYTSELYPTMVRNIGVGACCFWARIGSMMAPQINQWTKPMWGVDAIIFFGVISAIAGLCLFPLPETRNNTLPDSLNDVEMTQHAIVYYVGENESKNDQQESLAVVDCGDQLLAKL